MPNIYFSNLKKTTQQCPDLVTLINHNRAFIHIFTLIIQTIHVSLILNEWKNMTLFAENYTKFAKSYTQKKKKRIFKWKWMKQWKHTSFSCIFYLYFQPCTGKFDFKIQKWNKIKYKFLLFRCILPWFRRQNFITWPFLKHK